MNLRLSDVTWLAPFAGATAGLMTQDAEISRHIKAPPSKLSSYGTYSTLLVGGMVGVGGGMYLWGKVRQDDHMQETGILSGEAAIDSFGAAYLMKYAFGRERPLEGDQQGHFRQGGQSFPSEHSALAWSVASVLAHEYPGPLTQILAYGGAGAISVLRVKARQHFPSDVLVGSALGWFIGREVYRAHHQEVPDLANYGTFERAGQTERTAAEMGSPYVPMDSWVYPAFDRLNGMGYVESAILSLRPWTRMECARLVEEAANNLPDEDLQAPDLQDEEAARLVEALRKEFRPEIDRMGGGRNAEVSLDSIYTRWTGISGVPLTDGYHFAQTIYNDYGRPYQEGNNYISGFTAHAVAGPLAFYVDGEYQHAPENLNPIERPGGTIFADEDRRLLLPPKGPIAGIDRFDPLEAYVVLNIKGWEASFGKQALWWGSGTNGPMLWSTNAEPMTMLRITKPTPTELPGFLHTLLGSIRTEFVIGQISGYHHVLLNPAPGQVVLVGNYNQALADQPFVNAQKIVFKPTPNLEFGVTRIGIVGGPGFPITTHNVLNNFFSSRGVIAAGIAPGDRMTGFDFTYRLPKLRKWLTLYNDSMSEDEINPIGYPRRSAMNPGIYLSHVPGIPKLDFRAEAAYTDLPGLRDTGFFYWDLRQLDGWTNNGNIVGDWVGREGRAMVFQSTYWLSPQNRFQFRVRKQGVNPVFLKGGTLLDYQGLADFQLKHDLSVRASVQYEHWDFPLLTTTKQSNLTTSIQLTWQPKKIRWQQSPDNDGTPQP